MSISKKGVGKSSPVSLPALAEWGIDVTNTFEKYLKEYQSIPQYKKILHTMINFSDMYTPLPYKNLLSSANRTIAGANEIRKIKRAQIYMNKKELITTTDNKHGKRIVVTSRGHKIFYEDYPLAKLRKNKWEGNWTLVMYDFPEKIRSCRDTLRSNLIKMGFGSPQISTLVTPLPVEKPILQLLEGRELENYVWVLTCKKLWGLSDQKIAGRSWPLKELNRLYKALLEALPKVREVNTKSIIKEWQEYYLALVTNDPQLPAELLPKNWLGEICKKEFSKLETKDLFWMLFQSV